MLDIKLNARGDIDVSAVGDISITESIRQAILVRLRWIFREWRLGPEMGFPWFEEVFVKNPNTERIRQLVRNEIMQVEGVKAANVKSAVYDRAKRAATFSYTCTIGNETYMEEVTLYESIRADAHRTEY